MTDEGTDWFTQRFTHESNETRRNHEEVLGRLDTITATFRTATTLLVVIMTGEAANGQWEMLCIRFHLLRPAE